MIIGIDASRYNIEQKTGVEVYSMKIMEGLAKIANKKKTHQIIFYTNSRLPRRFGKVLSKGYQQNKTLQLGQRILWSPRLWTLFRLSWEMRKNPPDVLFIPAHVMPFIHPKSTIITIHDVAFMFFKKSYSFFQYNYLMFSTKFACKNAEKIIVPSISTKDDLIAFFNCPSEKIIVIPHGIEFTWKKDLTTRQEDEILQKFGLSKNHKYIFFVGRLESKKNLQNIILAFKEYHLKYDQDIKLVLAGKPGIGFKDIKNTIHKECLEHIVLMTGYVSEVDKEILLKYSKAFIFVSLYEGFGFPILEAFRDKIPVITSNTSAMREVAGEGAYRVNPLDRNEILKAFVKVLSDTTIRYYMIDNGTKQLQNFDWNKTSEKTWEVLTGARG